MTKTRIQSEYSSLFSESISENLGAAKELALIKLPCSALWKIANVREDYCFWIWMDRRSLEQRFHLFFLLFRLSCLICQEKRFASCL